MEVRVSLLKRLVQPQMIAVFATIAFLVVGFSVQVTQEVTPSTSSMTAPVISHQSLSVPSTGASSHIDCSKQSCVALTFDDGPNPITTPQILDELEAAHASASFFVVGIRAKSFPSLLQRMNRDGYEIGNHSWNHADLTTLSAAQIKDQVARTQAAVLAAGLPAPTLFRPPYGAINDTVRANIPLAIAMWNNDPEDWMKSPDPNALYNSVIQQLKPGRVVILHDIDQTTVTELPRILQTIQAQHYQLVTFSQLFNLSPNATGEYFGR